MIGRPFVGAVERDINRIRDHMPKAEKVTRQRERESLGDERLGKSFSGTYG